MTGIKPDDPEIKPDDPEIKPDVVCKVCGGSTWLVECDFCNEIVCFDHHDLTYFNEVTCGDCILAKYD